RRYSAPGGTTSATRSPARTPRCHRPAAYSSDSRSTSAYVIGKPSRHVPPGGSSTYAVRSPNRLAASRTVSGSMTEAYKRDRRTTAGRRTSTSRAADANGARDRRAQGSETRGRLLDAGLAVFAERGYHASRVDDILRAAATSHGTFYLY